jgi:hypothetical protein
MLAVHRTADFRVVTHDSRESIPYRIFPDHLHRLSEFTLSSPRLDGSQERLASSYGGPTLLAYMESYLESVYGVPSRKKQSCTIL